MKITRDATIGARGPTDREENERIRAIDRCAPQRGRMPINALVLEGPSDGEFTRPPLQQVRCACGRRLYDAMVSLEKGRIIIEIMCEKCKGLNTVDMSR